MSQMVAINEKCSFAAYEKARDDVLQSFTISNEYYKIEDPVE
jgi:hypothetical protein